MNVLEELKMIAADIEKERESDIIQRTLAKLIKIEKEAMYGAKTSNKTSRIEKVLESEFSAYKEKVNASSEN